MKKEFLVDTEIYSSDTIDESIEAYADVCQVTYNQDGILIFDADEQEIDTLFHEFMNYVISL